LVTGRQLIGNMRRQLGCESVSYRPGKRNGFVSK